MYFQRVLMDKVAFFYIHMVNKNLHRNGISLHSVLNSLELFFFIFFKKNLNFGHFFHITGQFEYLNLVLKLL